MENLKKFNTQEEYQAWKDGDDYVYPNVCKVGDEVIYNGYPEPFWIEALEDVTVYYKSYSSSGEYRDFYCSFDKVNWTLINYNGTVLRKGQKAYIYRVGSLAYNTFRISGRYNVGGSILSLKYGLDYLKYNSIQENHMNLFHEAKQMVSAKELVLCYNTGVGFEGLFNGQTMLEDTPKLKGVLKSSDRGIEGMFSNCTSLVKAPTIPSFTTGTYYNTVSELFYGCSNLNYIKAMFTQPFRNNNNSYTKDWVNGVAEKGTFIANVKRTDFTRGVYGIPEGWDLYLYDVENDRYVVKFNVNGIPYEFYTDEPRDVRWDEFIDSEYNTNGFYKGEFDDVTRNRWYVRFGKSTELLYILLNDTPVFTTDNIVLNASYVIGNKPTTEEE
jgi:hypothetical protein